MDEIEEDDVVSVGQQLRDAREALGLSIEDVAATTRIPMRHLASLEIGDWDQLPASTYSIGFAKNYAAAVGLDKAEIATQLRVEMGGFRQVAPNMEVYESTDPARTPHVHLIGRSKPLRYPTSSGTYAVGVVGFLQMAIA